MRTAALEPPPPLLASYKLSRLSVMDPVTWTALLVVPSAVLYALSETASLIVTVVFLFDIPEIPATTAAVAVIVAVIFPDVSAASLLSASM